jgi:hypothetical protein
MQALTDKFQPYKVTVTVSRLSSAIRVLVFIWESDIYTYMLTL